MIWSFDGCPDVPGYGETKADEEEDLTPYLDQMTNAVQEWLRQNPTLTL
jgi:hypothetical protein